MFFLWSVLIYHHFPECLSDSHCPSFHPACKFKTKECVGKKINNMITKTNLKNKGIFFCGCSFYTRWLHTKCS